MWPNPQETAGLVTFTEEILIENVIFCAADDVAETGRNTKKNLIFHQKWNDGDIWGYLDGSMGT